MSNVNRLVSRCEHIRLCCQGRFSSEESLDCAIFFKVINIFFSESTWACTSYKPSTQWLKRKNMHSASVMISIKGTVRFLGQHIW